MARGLLEGRTCLVTGASAGIGEQTALGLAQHGARVVLVCRNAERGERARARIARKSGNGDVKLMLADLASVAEIRRLAGDFLAVQPELHVLVNNAGVVNLRRSSTVDGLETTFAVNHLAYFLLTHLLRERLVASAPSRIVNVASDAHKWGRLDFSDLQSEANYGGMRVYGTSKLANILFTYELARRLEGTAVTANCVHPGPVASQLGKNNGAFARVATALLKPFFLSPADGAATSIYAASAPELDGVSGKYFAKQREKRSSQASRDPALASRLWEASAALVGVDA
ncbi:MAG: SDR family oxidoreductase [Myxococcota bacterium]